MRVIVASYGSAGDTFQFLALAGAIARRGHDVLALINGRYGNDADRAGVAWEPIGGELDPAELVPGHSKARGSSRSFAGSTETLVRHVLPHNAPLYRRLEAMCAPGSTNRPDVIVAHHVSLGAGWAGERFGLPWIVGAVAPSSWVSVDDPSRYPGMPDLDRYPRWTVRLGNALGERAMNRVVDRPMNALRVQLGLPPATGQMFAHRGAHGNLGLWSPVFRAPAPDDPHGSAIVGFPMLDHERVGTFSPRVGAFLGEGEPPIVVTMGTTATRRGEDLYQRIARVCVAAGRRCILLTGQADRARALCAPGEGVCASAYEPHLPLFVRAAGVVFHGGVGTLAKVLASGVPAVVVPGAHDQFDNARRLRLLGVARVMSGRAIAREPELSRAIDELATNTTSRARSRDIARAVSSEPDPAVAAAQHIERIGEGGW